MPLQALVYETLLPYFNQRPLTSNGPDAPIPEGSPDPYAGGAAVQWFTPSEGGDPCAAQLVAIAATTALQLCVDERPGAGPNNPPTPDAWATSSDPWALSSVPSAGAPPPTGAAVPSYSNDGLSLMLRHQLLLLAQADLRAATKNAPAGMPPISAADGELLAKACSRLSACSPALAAGAATLSSAELTTMMTELDAVRKDVEVARSFGTVSRPGLGMVGEKGLKGPTLHPLFDRLQALPDVEKLAGDAREPPVVLPVELSLVPDSVETFADASNALQHTVHLCTLLANQRGLVQNSYALRVSLIAHVFLRVLPLPLPPTYTGRSLRCFWAASNRSITHDTQAELLRWLALLTRHFAAASLSLPLTPSSDAMRMLVFASMTAISDAVLRLKAKDVPSPLSLHYSGAAEGPAAGFALEMRHFERESERCQLLQPSLAAARTLLLDYFRDTAVDVPADRYLFRFERSMELGVAEKKLLGQVRARRRELAEI